MCWFFFWGGGKFDGCSINEKMVDAGKIGKKKQWWLRNKVHVQKVVLKEEGW